MKTLLDYSGRHAGVVLRVLPPAHLRLERRRVAKRAMRRMLVRAITDAKRLRDDAGRWMLAGRARLMSEEYGAIR